MCRKSSTTGSRTDPQKRAHVSPFSPLCRPPRRTPNDENTPRGQSRGGVFASPGAFPRGRFLCFRGQSRVFFIYDFGRSAVRDIFVFGFAGHASGGRTPRFSGVKNTFSGRIRRKNTVRNPRKPDRDLPSERDSEKGRKGTRLPPKAENPPLPTQKTPHKAGPEMREKEGRGRKAA